MDIEEKKEKLNGMQKYFVKSFWLSFVILLIASLMCILMHDTQMAIVNKYFPVSADHFNLILMLVFGIWKVLIIQFTLVPALVLTCMKNCCCKETCKMD